MDRTQRNSKIMILISVLCALDIAGFFLSRSQWQGMNSEDSIPALALFAACALNAVGLEFLTILLPKCLRFTIPVLIVFNALFLFSYYYTAFKFEVHTLLIFENQPVALYNTGIIVFTGFALFPVFNIVSIVAAFIIRKANIRK